jgi:hypothetical protein
MESPIARYTGRPLTRSFVGRAASAGTASAKAKTPANMKHKRLIVFLLPFE